MSIKNIQAKIDKKYQEIRHLHEEIDKENKILIKIGKDKIKDLLWWNKNKSVTLKITNRYFYTLFFNDPNINKLLQTNNSYTIDKGDWMFFDNGCRIKFFHACHALNFIQKHKLNIELDVDPKTLDFYNLLEYINGQKTCSST